MGFPKPRALILDDDPEQLLLLGRSLRAAGYDVEMLTSPIGITNVARRIQPDIVMLDVNVPALSGDQLVEGIRRQHAAARIILYSGADPTTLHSLAKSAGADGWIQKGTPMDDILRKLRRLCSTPNR